ncbi:MAG: arginine--tRNA ligase [Planctomycetes bacterium]|nr:arginine--tRNA ligase [Planctomycetota bacterium]
MRNPFRRAAASFVASATGMDPSAFAVTDPPGHAAGDWAVGLFPAAKAKGANPAALAAEAAAAFTPRDGLASAAAAGPFVNFTADRAALAAGVLRDVEAAGARWGGSDGGAGRTVVIDFSSPNIAKHLAFHHIRSTMIGNALARLHRACGWKVVGVNHLGDWGTTFGMLLVAWEEWAAPGEVPTVDRLNDLYVRFRAAAKADPALDARARARFAALEAGDPAARALWGEFRRVSLEEYRQVYDMLGVSFDLVMGESEFEEFLGPAVEMLRSKGLVTESDGAEVVDLSADGMPPCLLRKGDGATLYATRDIAAALWRYEHHAFDRALYVVDRGQALHFRQWRRVLERAGFPFAAAVEHVDFGQVRFGGFKTGTRTGNVIRLREVLEEAIAVARRKIEEKNPGLAAKDLVARQVGVGAVIFNDLSNQRRRDVDFDWDRMLSFEGDTGPYLQYAHARTASMLRRVPAGLPAGDPARLLLPEEAAVLRLLADFPDRVEKAAADAEPCLVTTFLLDLCAAFSRWYDLGNRDPALKVLCEDRETAAARVRLARAVRATLERGLFLVGMEAPEEM